jgi:hypothetical protein
MLIAAGQARSWAAGGRVLHALAVAALPAAFLLVTTRDEVYNILWTLVFGFATLNILSLGARRLDSHRSNLNFGEILAILIVVVSVVLLAWELLYVFGILPIHLTPR